MKRSIFVPLCITLFLSVGCSHNNNEYNDKASSLSGNHQMLKTDVHRKGCPENDSEHKTACLAQRNGKNAELHAGVGVALALVLSNVDACDNSSEDETKRCGFKQKENKKELDKYLKQRIDK